MKQFQNLPFIFLSWADGTKFFYLLEWIFGQAWRMDYGWELHLSGMTAHEAMIKANISTRKDYENHMIVKEIWMKLNKTDESIALLSK